MKPEQLKALRELCDRATPGPWSAEQEQTLSAGCRCLSCWEPVLGVWRVENDRDEIAAADAELMSTARTAIPELLDYVAELEDKVSKLQDTLSDSGYNQGEDWLG